MLLSWTPRLKKKCVKLNPWYSLINSFCFILFILFIFFLSFSAGVSAFLGKGNLCLANHTEKKNGDWYKKKKFLIEWGNLHGYTLYLWEKKYIKTERNTSLSPYLLGVQIFKII